MFISFSGIFFSSCSERSMEGKIVFTQVKGDLKDIDYKTGKSDKKYHYQLNNYAQAIEKLGHKVSKKLLIYIRESIVIEEV
jgi:CRISPR/Cas system-associated exonuclease Cas4 (RecB family)